MSQSTTPQSGQPSQSATPKLRQRLQSLTTQRRGRVVLAGCVSLMLIVAGILGLIRSPWWYVPILILLVVLGIIGIIAIVRIAGTGFKEYTKISTTTETTDPTSSPPQKISRTEEKQPAKTLWDWSQLLIIPIFLLVAALVFGLIQNAISFQMSDTQHKNDMNLAATQQAVDKAAAADQQRETEIKSYFDTMSTLLENPHLRDSKAGVDLRSLARAQTLTVLSELVYDCSGCNAPIIDGVRKARVVRFLHDAGLINRGSAALSVPVVSLTGADLSGAALSRIDLGGADLAAVDLTGADLRGADLMGADLDQANLRGVDLNGAMLDYTQLDGADLRCAGKNQNCTDLTNADLSGADFTQANLSGAIFKNTDVSGTNPQGNFTKVKKSELAYTTTWKAVVEHNILKVSYNQGDSIAVHGILDLNTGKLQLVYGPLGNAGTSVVLFPAVWSGASCPTNYCQTALVTGGSYSSLTRSDLSQNKPLSFTVSGTIAGLSVMDTLTFSLPQENSMSVTVSATSSGSITLDQSAYGGKLHREAFKPIILTAMYDAPDTWTAQKAAFGNRNQPSILLSDVYTDILKNNISTFELIGGTPGSVNVRNASTVSVTLVSLTDSGNDLTANASVTLQVLPNSDSSVDNVSMWLGLDSPADAWKYTVTASIPPI